jgi:hypothetical protein
MAKHGSFRPAGASDDEDEAYYFETSPKKIDYESPNQNNKVKVIKTININAGIDKSNFDISLDTNSQQWFNQIYQYWRQCEFSS